MTALSWLTISSHNPQDLSDDELRKLAEIEKDMWAYWIWEYVRCWWCWKVHSKADVYWHENESIRQHTVTQLEEIMQLDAIKCNDCWSDTDFIYDEDKNLPEIKSRLLDRPDSYLVLARDEEWIVRGFMDGYVAEFMSIYQHELESHYARVWREVIESFIRKKLWWDMPNQFLSFSSLWTEQRYQSFYIIYQMLRVFFDSIPDEQLDTMWITELDTGGSLHAFYHCLGVQKLGLSEREDLASLIDETWDGYRSDIYTATNMKKI